MSGRADRLRELDGLRGIAITAVVVFHYFGRWTVERGQPLYPYGSVAPWTTYGAAGVDLFFVVSGFVIFLSLQNSTGFGHFLTKRADRLVPPMLVMSIVTFVTLVLIPTPFMDVRLADFLPSWTFTHPVFFKWLDPMVGYVDGAYWTLFYEVRFYALVAALWFFVSREKAQALLVVLALLATAISLALSALDMKQWLSVLELLTMYSKLPLFVAGVFLADVYTRGAMWPRFIVVALLLIAAVAGNGPASAPTLGIIMLMVSAVALRLRWAKVFALAPLVYIGAASYSLYLIHQDVGVALIHLMPQEWPLWAHLLGVAAITRLVLAIARLSYGYIEQSRPFTRLLTLYQRRPVRNQA